MINDIAMAQYSLVVHRQKLHHSPSQSHPILVLERIRQAIAATSYGSDIGSLNPGAKMEAHFHPPSVATNQIQGGRNTASKSSAHIVSASRLSSIGVD